MAANKRVERDNPRAAGDLDLYVGARIRTRRHELGMSQEKLAEEIGVTFQQIQKYEKGVNRVAAATLYRIVKVLDVPLTSFFPAAAGRASFDDVSGSDALSDDALAKINSRLNAKGRTLLAGFAQTLLSYDSLTKRR